MILKHCQELLYFRNPTTVLVVKSEFSEQTRETFRDSEMKVMKNGEQHIDAVIGTERLREYYVENKVINWVIKTKS